MFTEQFNAKGNAPVTTGGWLKIFRPAPPAAVTITDPAQISAQYSRWHAGL